MRARGWYGAPAAQAGFQRHHLIPVSLMQRPQMAAMFEQLRIEGFALHHFDRNGLVLPACEPAALRSGHALHRGGLQTDQQWGAANAYRAHCESARPPIGVAAIEPRVGNAWADPEAPMAAAIERGFAGDQLRQVHDAMSPEQAVVLQAVAGRGESVRGLAGGGRRWQANHSLLIEALAIADLTFRAVRNSRLPDRNAKCI